MKLSDNWTDKSTGDLFRAAFPPPPPNLALRLNWEQRQAWKVLVEVFGADQVTILEDGQWQ